MANEMRTQLKSQVALICSRMESIRVTRDCNPLPHSYYPYISSQYLTNTRPNPKYLVGAAKPFLLASVIVLLRSPNVVVGVRGACNLRSSQLAEATTLGLIRILRQGISASVFVLGVVVSRHLGNDNVVASHMSISQ